MAGKKIVIAMIAGQGFHDSEFTEPRDYFTKKEVKLEIATGYKVGDEDITGVKGTPLTPTIKLKDLHADAVDAVAIVGGYEGPGRLRVLPEMTRILQEMKAHNRIIAMICHGPWLACSNKTLFAGYKATCYPDMKDDLQNAGMIYVDQAVVVDRNLITSPSPRESITWAETIYDQAVLSIKI